MDSSEDVSLEFNFASFFDEISSDISTSSVSITVFAS